MLTKLALELLVLTFVRSGELRGARWSEFDIDKKQWCIPGPRMNMRKCSSLVKSYRYCARCGLLGSVKRKPINFLAPVAAARDWGAVIIALYYMNFVMLSAAAGSGSI